MSRVKNEPPSPDKRHPAVLHRLRSFSDGVIRQGATLSRVIERHGNVGVNIEVAGLPRPRTTRSNPGLFAAGSTGQPATF